MSTSLSISIQCQWYLKVASSLDSLELDLASDEPPFLLLRKERLAVFVQWLPREERVDPPPPSDSPGSGAPPPRERFMRSSSST